jgi:flavin reductase (DIM6/NTAB) family NADH-FMN oxidoreductase RutF
MICINLENNMHMMISQSKHVTQSVLSSSIIDNMDNMHDHSLNRFMHVKM